MPTSRLSAKGQIVLPKEILESHAWKAGMEFLVEDTVVGVLLRPAAKPFPPTTLDEVVGIARYKGKPKTLAEMDAAIGREVMRRHERGRY
jgi:bifunctional DNA-binding transcriptional regulator/antitoxin component of YhaV-PrlF toxin-antitoxin module